MIILSCTFILQYQSILNDDPYHNVPVDEPSNAKGYAEYVRHEVLRVAVCQMISNPLPTDILPVRLRETIISLFPSFYDSYELTCLENSHMDGQV